MTKIELRNGDIEGNKRTRKDRWAMNRFESTQQEVAFLRKVNEDVMRDNSQCADIIQGLLRKVEELREQLGNERGDAATQGASDVEAMRKAVEERDRTVEELRHRLGESEAKVNHLVGVVAERDDAIRALRGEVDELREASDASSAEVSRLEERNEILTRENTALAQNATAAQMVAALDGVCSVRFDGADDWRVLRCFGDWAGSHTETE